MLDRSVQPNASEATQQLVAAIYSRISTVGQSEGISLDDQDTRMLHYAQAHNIYVPADYRFREQASGFKQERDEYEKIRQLIRNRRINVLIVYSSDRHTRDPIHGIIFRAELRRSNCQLHFVSEGQIDIVSAQGELLNTIRDAFNKYWALMILQTTQDKKKAYTNAGVPLQQGMAPLGYKRVGRKAEARFEVVPEDAEIVREVFDLFDPAGRDFGTREVARRMQGKKRPSDRYVAKSPSEYGQWTDFGVYLILNNESYAGTYYANRVRTIDGKRVDVPREEWIAIPVPAIISQEQWQRVQAKLKRGKSAFVRAHAKYDYLIARRVRCRNCGTRMHATSAKTSGGKVLLYYDCSAKSHNMARIHALGGKCTTPTYRTDAVDHAVWEFTKQLLSNPRAMLTALKDIQQEQRKQNAELFTRKAELDELIADQARELDVLVRDLRRARGRLFETMQRQADEIETTIAGLERERAKLQDRVSETTLSDEDITDIERFAGLLAPKLEAADFATKREMIEKLNFRFELSFEEGEKFIYIIWHIYEFRAALVCGDFKLW